MKTDNWMQDFIKERITYYEKYLVNNSDLLISKDIEEGLKVLKQLQDE